MSCFMIVATACRIDESLSVFSFECDSWPSVARSWTMAVEEKEFAGHSIGYCFTDLVPSGFVFVNGSLTVCYLYRNSGSKNRPKILAYRHLLTNQICILLFYFKA